MSVHARRLVPIHRFQPAKRVAGKGLARRPSTEHSLQTHVGDVIVNIPADLEKLRGVGVLEGDLIIHNTRVKDLAALKDMALIRGNLIVRNNKDLKDVSALLPQPGRNKLEVHGLFLAENNGVAPNKFRLEAHGDVVIRGAADLEKVRRLGLRRVPGNLIVRDTNLETLKALDGIVQVDGAMEISGNRVMRDGNLLPNLKYAGSVYVFDNPKFERFLLPELRRIGNAFTFIQNRAAASLSLPSLEEVGHSVVIRRNPRLSHLNMMALQKFTGSPYLDIRGDSKTLRAAARPIVDRFRQPLLDFFRRRPFVDQTQGPTHVTYGRQPDPA
jgi:hypothetical protein